MIYSCNNAFYHIYGYSFSLTNLVFIENIGLNNIILPVMIILTNLILILGLKRRNYLRRHRLGKHTKDDWKERSVILYMLFSSLVFVILTTPIGILGIWGLIYGKKIPNNNLSLVFDLMEILHHCSHFPILLMTSSMIRKKLFQTRLQRQKLIWRKHSTYRRSYTPTVNQQEVPFHPRLTTLSTGS
jgi:hypothetical protein